MPLLSVRLSSGNSNQATIKRSPSTPSLTSNNETCLNQIAIVGGGIAGLCTALSLVRTAHIPGDRITIYEPRTTLDKGEGSGLNLNSAAAILCNEYGIDLSQMIDGGVNIDRAVSTFYTQPKSPKLFDIDFRESFKHLPYLSKEDGSVHIVTILRENLQKILYKCVKECNINIIRGQKYKIKGITDKRELIFNDDTVSEQSFDLIIGADGVHSNIRKYIKNKMNLDTSKKKAKYTGVRVAWVLADRSNNSKMDELVPFGEMRQYVCDGGTVVSYALTKKKNMIAFLYREKLSSKENTTFKKDESGRRQIVAKRMKLTNCPEEFINQFESKGDRFIESAVYEHIPLSRWSHNNVVLVGDAAHAMAPFLGQGANQTIQDAHVLGLVLRKLSNEYKSVNQALEAYESVFKNKVDVIRKKSRVLGFLYTQQGVSGHLLRKGLLKLSRGTGLIEKDIISAFQPRFQ